MSSVESSRRRTWKNEPRVLFVEGYSDLTFYAEMLEHVGCFDGCFIQDLGGKGRAKLQDEALLLLKPDNLAKIKAVGVILDGDNKADAAFSLARNALQAAIGVDVPQAGNWFIPPNSRTRFGVFIAGGSGTQVEIESIAWSAWEQSAVNQPLKRCVESFVDCAGAAGITLKSIDKVRLGVAMSALNEDDPRLGPAARAKQFDFEASAFAQLRTFLGAMRDDNGRLSG